MAKPGDIPALQEIERKAAESFLTHPQTASLVMSMTPRCRYASALRSGMLLVAKSGRVPLGFAMVEDFGTSLHLEELDVDPAHQHRGIGTSLVREVCRMASAKGLPVTLRTFSEVPWNAPFYKKLGFVRLSAEELSPTLKRRVREETVRGLPPGIRVAMRFDAMGRRVDAGPAGRES
jgi:predicted N-acetyltransferase YhbS